MMELVTVKCDNCNREIYVFENYIREKMFCTLGFMNSYMDIKNSKKGNF
jgi:hypothetical protein